MTEVVEVTIVTPIYERAIRALLDAGFVECPRTGDRAWTLPASGAIEDVLSTPDGRLFVKTAPRTPP